MEKGNSVIDKGAPDTEQGDFSVDWGVSDTEEGDSGPENTDYVTD